MFAAALACAEKKYISLLLPNSTSHRISFYIKFAFVIVEVILLSIMTGTMYQGIWKASVVIEWVIALFFAFYMASFAVDLIAIPESPLVVVEKQCTICLAEQAWDEENCIAMPTRVCVLQDGKCVTAQ